MYIMWEPWQRFVHRESPDILATDERIDRTFDLILETHLREID